MKAKVNKTQHLPYELVYLDYEYSLDTMPYDYSRDTTLLINDIEVALNYDKKVIAISGLSPKAGWIEKDISFSETHPSGELILKYPVDSGGIIRIAEGSPIFFNSKSNWLCIGSDLINETSQIVRMFENTYAVVNDSKLGNFSFWAKIRILTNKDEH